VVLVTGIERLLRFTRRKRLAVGGTLLVVVAVFESLFANVGARVGADLLLIIRLALPKLLLSGGDQAKVMLRVLIVVFRRNGVTRTLRIPGELKIFFGDMRRRAANFYVRSVGLKNPRQWILMMMVMAALTIATSHALVLTVSHGSLFANPLDCDGNWAAISLNQSLRQTGAFSGQ